MDNEKEEMTVYEIRYGTATHLGERVIAVAYSPDHAKAMLADHITGVADRPQFSMPVEGSLEIISKGPGAEPPRIIYSSLAERKSNKRPDYN